MKAIKEWYDEKQIEISYLPVKFPFKLLIYQFSRLFSLDTTKPC